MSIPHSHDVIIAGCGPSGSSAATFLARGGKRVLILEKEVFPRFHIGESLLPYNQAIFRELGVLPAIQAEGFPRKFGAQFFLGNGLLSTRFVFSQGKFTREPEVMQVERAKFDHILLKHARASGADVREGWTVLKTGSDADGVNVEARDPEGKIHEFRAAFVIDASGRANLTGNQEGLRVVHPRLKKLAIFGHFTGVWHDAADAGGDTVIVRLENKWFWLIPISAEKTSVGLVLDKEEFAQSEGNPREIFQRWAESSPVMQKRMMGARLTGPMQTTSDFSYFNRRLCGNRLLRIGDAAGFMDPIFSAGVYLAMWSGKLAAEAIQKSLAHGDDGSRRFLKFEKRVKHGMHFYWQMVEHYYTKPFMELFLQPRNHASLPDAVNAVLAGELEGGWRLRWRLRYFFLLVKWHARRPLVPRLTFAPLRNPKTQASPCAEKV
ncbi:MAG TPA: NAD(P)/FAD-dependent oxidoreductase [Verrucomicrobiae bacterium]|nr:NAD(P)/FAD-dependent oxidoreductase [Verrucomicrobiae bacterium]